MCAACVRWPSLVADFSRGALMCARLTWSYFKVNLASAMEYRGSFFALSLGMIVNDTILFVFWWAYFERFGQVGGWTLIDTVSLYGLGAVFIGLATVVFGNCTRLPAL